MFEPIFPRIYLLKTEPESKIESQTSNLVNETINKDGINRIIQTQSLSHLISNSLIASDILNQIDEAQKTQSKHSKQHLYVLENKPAKFVCQFRPINFVTKALVNPLLPAQQVYWYLNDQLVHVPPFHVDSSLVSSDGLSVLTVRAYPNNENEALKRMNKQNIDQITCSIISKVKEKPLYKVTTNAR